MPKFKMRASFSKSCRRCGRAFVPNWSHVRKAWSEYCCKRCGQAGHYEANKTLVHPPFAANVLSELKALWDGGATCTELMSKYKVGDKYIRRELRRAGVDGEDFRPRGARGRRPTNARAYRFGAFSSRTPEAAYWAGFLMADGCIRDGGELLLNVHVQDRKHIELFAEWIGLPAESVYKSSGRMGSGDQSKIHLKHAQLLEDLEPWGVVPRKSYVFRQPKVPAKLFPHFVRGWFDGDGCVSLRKGRERCRITGNSNAMQWLGEQVEILSGVSATLSERKKGRVWAKLCVGGANNVLRFIEWMQPASATRLNRKWSEATAWAKSRREMLAHCKDGRVVRNNLQNGKQVRSHRLHASQRRARRSGSRPCVA
jgi:hypothetical protein